MKGIYQGTASEVQQGSKIASIGAFLVFQTLGMRSWLLSCRQFAAARVREEVYIEKLVIM